MCDGEADVYGPKHPDEPVDNVMFSRPAEDDAIFDLLFEVAKEGGMAILLPDGIVCLVDEAHATELPEDVADWPRHVTTTGLELAAVIRAA